MTTTDMPADSSRRLTRSREDRIVSGVCAGAARYWDIDPVIPRVVLAVLAVFGGAGLVIYAFAWLLIPEDGSPSTRVERWLEGKGGDRGRDLLIVVVALFAVSFLVDTNPFAHRVSVAAVLIVLAMTVVALIGRHRADGTGTPWPYRATSSGSASQPFGTTSQPFGPGPDPSSAPTAAWTAPAAPPRPRSWLGWATIGLTLLVAGIFTVVADAGWAHPQPADVLAACIGVLALGLLVGTFFGRAWSLIPVGLLLIVVLAVANALPRNLTWTAGTRDWAPLQVSSQPYVLGAGDATLDLTGLPLTSGSIATIDSRIGAGRLVVIVPSNVTVDVNAKVSAGRILILDREQDGTSVQVNRAIPGPVTKHPRVLTLNIAMGFGNVEVEHAAA